MHDNVITMNIISEQSLKSLQQVCQQACKMQIPPYSLMQRCRPEFRLPHRATANSNCAAEPRREFIFSGEICIAHCPNFSFFQGAMCI